MLKSRNLVQPEDFSIKEIDEILDLAQQIMANPDKYSEVCKGKLLATLFMNHQLELDLVLNQL